MRAQIFMGIVGVLMIAGGSISPMLRIPVIGNWTYWDIDIYLAMIMYLLTLVALFAVIFEKQLVITICGWSILALMFFTFFAVYFKVNEYFSFIPFKKWAYTATRVVNYRPQGWLLIFFGCLILLLSGKREEMVNRTPFTRL